MHEDYKADPDAESESDAPEDQRSNGQPAVTPAAPTATISAPNPNKRKKVAVLVVVVLVMAGAAGGCLYYQHAKAHDKAASTGNSVNATKPAVTISSASTIAQSIPAAINPTDPTNIPLGDNRTSTSPKVGYVYSCQTSFSASAGGAQVDGPWINTSTGTWNSDTKVKVSGAVKWTSATYAVSTSGNQHVVTGNDLPINGQTTGVFPVAATDKAYAYDRNPNTIKTQSISLNLPVNPLAATSPNCLPGGMIGMLSDGVVLFDALDGEGRDAGAHETLDSCDGHPEKTGEYHHHSVPSCIMAKSNTPSTSTLVGYAADGYGVYIERDKNGNLLTNANLDACHGRTSNVMWDEKVVSIYHYDATMEFPYTVGCFHGTSTVKQTQQPAGGSQQGPPPRP